eukprot:s3901_g4.t1
MHVEPYVEQIRASITDRRDFYHQAQVSPERAQSNMLPFVFTEDDLAGLRALEEAKRDEANAPKKGKRGFDTGDGFAGITPPPAASHGWYGAFGSLFQGDHLGVEFALEAHESLLLQSGLLASGRRIQGHAPFPLGKQYEGLIIDDFFAIGVEPFGSQPLSSFAAAALATAREAYSRHRLPGSIEKDIEAADKFKAAGAEIDSTPSAVRLGLTTVGAPLSKRLALSALSFRAARLPSTTSKLLSRLAGNWTSVLLYRRCMTCVVDDLFKLAAEAEKQGSNKIIHLPRAVATELCLLGVFGPILVSNIATKYLPTAFASDASLAKGAVVSSPISQATSQVLWLGSDKKGGYSKLDDAPKAMLASIGLELAADLRIEDEAVLHSGGPDRPLLLYFDFVEFFGGSGRVSAAALELGLVVAPPLDLDRSEHYNLSSPRLLEWAFHMIESGRFASFLTEPPCTTFSAAAHPALRSYQEPMGFDPSEPRTRHGNLLACRSFQLLRHGRRHHRPCGKEQPRLSKMAWLRAWAYCLQIGFSESVIASCQFGSPHRKEFRFLTYGIDSESLEARCPGGHDHIKIEGKFTRASAVYSWELARHLALHFARALRAVAAQDEAFDVAGHESPLTNDVLAAQEWKVDKVWWWGKKSHINVLESYAGHNILELVGSRDRSCRFPCILDSRVAKCALAKGRSSSSSLQKVCKKAGTFQFVKDLYPGWCFGPTRLNVADDPTRDCDIRPPCSKSLTSQLGIGEQQVLHDLHLSKPAANLLRLTLLVLLFQQGQAGGSQWERCVQASHERFCECQQFCSLIKRDPFQTEHDKFWVSPVPPPPEEHLRACNEPHHHWTIPRALCWISSSLCFGLSSAIHLCFGLAIGLSCGAFFWICCRWIFTKGTFLRGLVLPCLLGPLVLDSRVGFGIVLAAAMEPHSQAERARAAKRAGTNLIPTRVARKDTIERRRKLLEDFRWLVEYGQSMFAAGKAYGKFAETINAVANARPAIRKMLAPSWDLAFAWLADEPYQHHPALPLAVLLAMLTTALLWGWPVEAAIIGLTWSGVLRIGETLMATRADLILPEDAAPGTDFALLRIRMPKTRGRAAKHQAARIDPPDLIQLLAAVFGKYHEDAKLWPLSAATLRKRFNALLHGLGLPTTRDGGKRPFDLGSLRPGGATHLLLTSEDSEHVRRRGRWVTTKVCEIYLQEVMYTTYTEKLAPALRAKIRDFAFAFSDTLQVAIGFLNSGIPGSAWYRLYQPETTESMEFRGRMGIQPLLDQQLFTPAADGLQCSSEQKGRPDACNQASNRVLSRGQALPIPIYDPPWFAPGLVGIQPLLDQQLFTPAADGLHPGGLDDDAFSDGSDFEAFDRQLKRQDPYGRWVAANREERGHRERLVNIQGEFLNPVVALRMRAKNNPYRRKTLYDKLKEITNAEDACTRALRADRLEGWTRSTETTTRHVLKIDDDASNRTRPKSVRKSDAGADMVFMMDNADVLEDPVGRLRLVGEHAQRHREEEERRQDIEHRMAETQEKFGIQRMQIAEEKKKTPSPSARAVALQKKRATEVIVFEQPVSFAIGAFDKWMRGYLRRWELIKVTPSEDNNSPKSSLMKHRRSRSQVKSVGFDLGT